MRRWLSIAVVWGSISAVLPVPAYGQAAPAPPPLTPEQRAIVDLSMNAVRVSRAGDPGRGLQMSNEAIARAPNNAGLKLARAEILMATGDSERALTDLDAIFQARFSAGYSMARRLRAQALFNLGRWRDALAVYDVVVASTVRDDKGYSAGQHQAYAAFWRFTVQRKLGMDGRKELRDLLSRIGLHGWPIPIGRFLIGETTADQLERTARDDVVARQFGGDCEAAFYVGAVAERRSDRAAARASYRRAQQLCHHGMYERWAADAELRRLGQ